MDAHTDDERDELIEIERHPTEADANARAAALVAQGIGASVDHRTDDFPGGAYVVSVLPDDAVRARQVLGLAEPLPETEEMNEAELAASVRGWLIPVLCIAALFVIVPIAAFFITFKLQGG